MRLAARFASPAELFSSETFFGSHAAVARAVLDGTADVGATYAGFDQDGSVVRGPFLDIGESAESMHVVEAFGAIPPDVIAAHVRVEVAVADAVAEAFEKTRRDPEMLALVQTIFGATGFGRRPLVGYDLFRGEVEEGVDSGAIPAAAAFLSTRPPPTS
jgi:phosphonate transport system substrate-binding protein